MGGGPKDPLPKCERCQHFVVRSTELSICEPCRRGWQLQVSLRSVVSAERDETAVVFLQECHSLLEEWIGKLRELEAKEHPQASSARGRSPLKRREEPRDKQTQEKPHRPVAPPPKAPPVQGGDRVTSQNRAVPRPSQPPRGASRGRSPSKGLYAKKKAEPKALVDTPREVEQPSEVAADSSKGESKETPTTKEERKEKKKSKSPSSTSSSSRRRKKKEKRRREKEKRDRKRRRRSTSRDSSVSGSRVRAAKKKDLKRLPTPPRPKSPHTPPGPPPDPPPVPARDTSRPPLARGRGRGWIGRCRIAPIPVGTRGRTRASPVGPNKKSTTIGGGDVCPPATSLSRSRFEEEASR